MNIRCGYSFLHLDIDLDSDDDESTQKNEGSNKRRKISLSPQGNNNSSNPVGNNTRIGRTGKNIRIATISSASNNVTRVAVKECGISEMNGTYTREVGVLHENAPVYTKRGLWEGNDVKCKLCNLLEEHVLVFWPVE